MSNFKTQQDQAIISYETAKANLLSYMGSKKMSTLKNDTRFLFLQQQVQTAKGNWHNLGAKHLKSSR